MSSNSEIYPQPKIQQSMRIKSEILNFSSCEKNFFSSFQEKIRTKLLIFSEQELPV